MSITVQGVTRTFGAFHALRDVNIEIRTGEFLALLGPSGSGKTTLLRILAGLDFPDAGAIHFGGIDATDRAAQERGVGFVFQHYALFRHMTVFENIAFGLRVRPRAQRPPEPQIRERVTELLRLVQLEGLAGRMPSQLSGGQRQRVALARALAVEPRVLLLDEPFGALDSRVRVELRRWLRELHEQLNVTSIIVTHDQEEALELADRVVVMNHGAVEQIGTPSDLWDHPQNPFVLEFLGDVNIYPAQVRDGYARVGEIAVPVPRDVPEGPVRVGIRSFDLKMWASESGDAVVNRVVALADRVRVDATLSNGSPIFAQFPRRSSLLRDVEPGARVAIDVTHAHVYPLNAAGSATAAFRVRAPVAAE